ncbi:ParB/RepB/Spo0J family partition protein [Thiolapillus sp.]|uniref:ParB/RepB/Spo0J family partition protein n=1 Tax=Thiolapillus sp. TaxID=2017437 RepID=UPI0025D53C1F|nr:ParB/RepB/Spo0J family partition protein [Thiolapillus sp.]
MAKRGLGRGLDALLGGAQSAPRNNREAPAAGDGVPKMLAVDLVQRGRFQPRRHFDEDRLRELADSIAAQGVVQPVVVRPAGENTYELIAGERRWRAAQLAGLTEIPVVVRDVDDQAAMAMGLIENIQRDDLNPLEEAQALHRLLEEFELTHQQIAQAVGKSRTTVTNLMRLLELNPDVKVQVEAGHLEMGHARALLSLEADLQSQAAQLVVKKGLSVRETEALVRRFKEHGGEPARRVAPSVEDDPDVRRLIQGLTDRLGAPVQLKQAANGKGKLVISYNSLDELEGIMVHIK